MTAHHYLMCWLLYTVHNTLYILLTQALPAILKHQLSIVHVKTIEKPGNISHYLVNVLYSTGVAKAPYTRVNKHICLFLKLQGNMRLIMKGKN